MFWSKTWDRAVFGGVLVKFVRNSVIRFYTFHSKSRLTRKKNRMPRVARAKSGSRVEEFETRRPITLKNFKVCKIKYAIVTLDVSIGSLNAVEKPRTELTRDYDKK